MGYEIQTLKSVIVDIDTKKIFEKEIILWLKHIKKEDSDNLFGFINKDQRDFFIKILNIKGIGSQIGMSLLNKFSLNEINNAITNNDKKLISSVQGIGQKMTERLILELKSKVRNNKIEEEISEKNNLLSENREFNSIFEDINLTLESLNYSKKEIKNIYPKLTNHIKENKNLILEKDNFTFEALLKVAMNYLDNRK